MTNNEFRQGPEKVARLQQEAAIARLASVANRRRIADWLLSVADLFDPA